MARERVVLIDGSSMIYRAFFAIPSSFSTSRGLPTNATYGFALMFRKILAGRRPTMGAVVFDAPGKTFRDEKFPAYKAHRPKMPAELREQMPWIRRVVEAHDFPTVRVEGYEADDVIGTLTREALEAGHEVHIISADKDFAQLVGDDVRMIDTMRDITYDPALVRKKWGVPPAQIVDLLALMGDKVDNVPGVPGIGQKGAASLLAAHGSLAEVLAHVDELKGRARKALQEHADQARLSRELVLIDQHAELPLPLKDLTIPEPDLERVDALYRELEFFSLLSGGEGAEEVVDDDADFGAVRSVDELRAWLDASGDAPVAIHVLHEPPSFIAGTVVGVALARSAAEARFVPLFGGDGALGEPARAVLRTWLEDADAEKLVHDLRDQWTVLARHGIALRGVVADTQLASFLVDPTKIIPHRLDQCVREYLHRALAPEKSVRGSGKKERAFAEVPLDELATYACHLAAPVVEMWPRIEARLEEVAQVDNLHALSMPMALLLGRMQLDGIRVDPDVLRRLGKEFEARKAEVEAHIYDLAGRRFNVGSPKQLSEVLFEDLGLPVIKRTKTGYSTAADVLERLAGEHEICRGVLRQRALAKLINTYTRVLFEAIEPETGRIHCTMQQTTGSSGRLITTDPDLQRTPIRTEDGKRIREAFIPRDGWVLVSADWSQIELRILAHFSGDPLLIEAFTEGVDVHRRTASQLFDVPPDEVDSAQRDVGKTVNFATIYGQGATALGQSLGIPRKEAKAIIERYFERYAMVREWLDETIAQAHALGWVTTLAGRRRQIPELSSRDATDRAYGERVAANTPIQGSAADLCKMAMLQIDARFAEAELEGKMLLQIHDELLFECPPHELEVLEAIVRDRMEHAVELRVPLVVDIGHGPSWAAAKE
ncbi:MAG TPA: DNA polymerase I [Sandaracinaceae bacterium LLY-WYZ-13_1]|nr:DNA polymerase I [Sandaracinaceae bacterium LLY-WYZ-13_1]